MAAAVGDFDPCYRYPLGMVIVVEEVAGLEVRYRFQDWSIEGPHIEF